MRCNGEKKPNQNKYLSGDGEQNGHAPGVEKYVLRHVIHGTVQR